ncbi:MAG: energy-coupling factor ABC transporter ATP-binding protein [Halanaeroarchaeum sp.]
MSEGRSPAIRAEELTFAYEDGPPVVRGVDLTVEDGTVVALMGPNGAGKTTLLKLLAGLYDPDEGTVTVDGATGFAAEDPADALFAETVAEEVAFFPRNRGLDVEARVEAALEAMGIEHLRDRTPQSLAVGEQRRVSLAAVLAGDPAVVALDEPTSGLDAPHVETLGDRLRAIDRTVVVATHDADFALRWTDRVAVVTAGTVAASGSAEDLLGDPGFDFEGVGIRPPGPVAFAREQGWGEVPLTVEAAAERLERADAAGDGEGEEPR